MPVKPIKTMVMVSRWPARSADFWLKSRYTVLITDNELDLLMEDTVAKAKLKGTEWRRDDK